MNDINYDTDVRFLPRKKGINLCLRIAVVEETGLSLRSFVLIRDMNGRGLWPSLNPICCFPQF